MTAVTSAAVRSALRQLAPLADRFAAILAARNRVNIAGGPNWSTPRRVEHDLDHALPTFATQRYSRRTGHLRHRTSAEAKDPH